MISEEFKNAYKKLNFKQKEAVDTIEGPVMVIAGPGTGKTTILTLRIANILKETDTPPSGILALTFTEAGVKAMRMKLREMIGERTYEVPIHTFHGFASSIITEFGDHFPHLYKSKQITDIEAESMMREIIRDKKFSKLRPLGEPDFYVNKILGAISKAKQEAWSPEMVKSFVKEEIEHIKKNPDSISTRGASKDSLKADALKQIEKCERTIIFADVYNNYELKKIESRKMDFDDLIFELLKTLRTDKLLLQILQEKFLYILVDEHQDTNDSQNLIVKLIADFFDNPNLFVVGDEKQAIYRFQGASVENFLSFQKMWNSMKVISLVDNYRSHQNILDASFKMIEQNYSQREYEDLRIKLISCSREIHPLDIVIAPNIEIEDEYLLEKLNEIIKKETKETVAIIVRRNSDVSHILNLLEINDIPASAERGVNIFSHPLGQLFFSLLEFLVDSSKTEALAETFAGGLWELDFASQAELIKMARSGNLREIEKKIPLISKLKNEIRNSGVMNYLILASDISGFTKLASESPLASKVWRGIYNLAEDLVITNYIEDPQKLTDVLLAYRASAEKKSIKIKSGKITSQINIMTAHSSKGLEFDYVFMPYAVEEFWIRKNRGSYFVLPIEKDEEDNIRDERRLFYVSLTRAKKHVSISISLEDNQSKVLTPLRFIDELDSSCLSQTNYYKTTKLRPSLSIEKIQSKRDEAQIDYAKKVLLENGLSVTALNHFLVCPIQFFYKSILKLPEPPSANSEKGNAMHEALANVWKNNGKDIQNIIENTVHDYFKHSLLPLFEKEAIVEELIVSAPKVALALVDHFNQNGNVLVESWIETYLYFSYKKEKIELKLHGKLDAIIEKEKEVLVFDYKTREAKSPAALRGETAGETGDYFRQLVFYKMLLESNKKFVGKTIEPALVFVKPDSKNRCPTITPPITETDIEKVRAEINSLIESVWSGKILNSFCSDKDCKYCGYQKLGKTKGDP
ncbi:MAG: ATP-dependent DNA helicase [Patescibacteria group bacterium]